MGIIGFWIWQVGPQVSVRTTGQNDLLLIFPAIDFAVATKIKVSVTELRVGNGQGEKNDSYLKLPLT